MCQVSGAGSEMKQETKEHSKNTVSFFTLQFLLKAEGIFFLLFVEVLSSCRANQNSERYSSLMTQVIRIYNPF